jgi:hypothetical protein
VLESGQLQPIDVKTGLTDGMTTAVVDGALAERAEVITGIAAQAASAAPAASSPLIPQRPGGSRAGATTRRQGAGR